MSCKVQYSTALQFSEKWEWEGCGHPGKGEARQGDILAKAVHCSVSSALEAPDPSPAAAVPSHRARAPLVTLCSRKLKKKKQKKTPGPKIGYRLVSGGWSGLGRGNCMHLHTQTHRQALRNRVQMSRKPLTQINSCSLTQAGAQQCPDMCWAV